MILVVENIGKYIGCVKQHIPERSLDIYGYGTYEKCDRYMMGNAENGIWKFGWPCALITLWFWWYIDKYWEHETQKYLALSVSAKQVNNIDNNNSANAPPLLKVCPLVYLTYERVDIVRGDAYANSP